MKILYKCRCMSAEAEIEVRDRAASEDVVEWMDGAVASALSADHVRRSPLCSSATTEYVKVPLPENAPFIGGRPKLDS